MMLLMAQMGPMHWWWLKEGFRCLVFCFSDAIGIGLKKVEGAGKDISASSPDCYFLEGNQGHWLSIWFVYSLPCRREEIQADDSLPRLFARYKLLGCSMHPWPFPTSSLHVLQFSVSFPRDFRALLADLSWTLYTSSSSSFSIRV